MSLFPDAQTMKETKIEITLDALAVVCLIGSVQLACRHPKNTGPSRQVAENVARDLQKILVEKLPATEAILTMGWDPDFDI